MSKTPGAELAAMRRTETKQCPECGEEFTGLVKIKYCKRCRNKFNVRQFREKRRAEMKTLTQQIVSEIKQANDDRETTISNDQSNEVILEILQKYGLDDDEDLIIEKLGIGGLHSIRDAEQGIY